MKFYRYQGTKTLETKSRYVDLNLLYEDVDEYKNEFETKEELKDYLFDKYKNSLQLRNNIEPKHLFDKVVNTIKYVDVESLTYNYPLDGLFGEESGEVESNYSLLELLKECPWHCENDKYLVLYEGQKIAKFGDEGTVFKPMLIISTWKRY